MLVLQFAGNVELKNALNQCLNKLVAKEYGKGILKPVNRYDNGLNSYGDYVEH